MSESDRNGISRILGQEFCRRSQADRRAETRTKLLEAARSLFIEMGFAETPTPEIVCRAGVTRGALYHHFADKADLFRTLVTEEAQAVSIHIDRETRGVTDPEQAMVIGSNAYFEAMLVPGRVRLVLEEAPAILGHRDAVALTRANGSEELREGLMRARPGHSPQHIEALTSLLSAAFDRAALEIAYGGDRVTYTEAMLHLVDDVLDGG